MKKLFLALICAASLAAGAVTDTINVKDQKVEFRDMTVLGSVVIPKHLTVLDSKNSGTLNVSMTRTAKVKVITPQPYTKLGSKYDRDGRTITGAYYRATNGTFCVEMPRQGSSGNTTYYGADKWRYDYINYDYGIGYNIGTVTSNTGRVWNNVIAKDKWNILNEIGYSEDLTQEVRGTIKYMCQNWYQIDSSGGTAVLVKRESDQNCTNVVCTGTLTNNTVATAPMMIYRGSTTLPDTFIQPLSYTNWIETVEKVTRNIPICTTNYSNGSLEYDFPPNIYMVNDYTLKIESPALTNRTSNIRFIYER